MKLTPRDRHGMSGRTRPHSLKSSGARDDEAQAPKVVGIAHVILGAVGLTAAGVGLLFSAQTPLLVAVLLARVVFESATCCAGLLITDGQRKGAVVALVTGALRIALLLVTGSMGLMLVVSVVLLGAAGWLLPSLARGEVKRASA